MPVIKGAASFSVLWLGEGLDCCGDHRDDVVPGRLMPPRHHNGFGLNDDCVRHDDGIRRNH